MKKLLIICTILMLSGVSCKKICACSPVQASLFLVVKNAAGQDIFNPSTPGYYTKDQVSLTAEGPAGTGQYPITFSLKPTNERLGNYHILVNTIAAAVHFSPIVYLKIGNQTPYALQITIAKDGRRIDRLLIDGKNIPYNKKPDFFSLFYFSM